MLRSQWNLPKYIWKLRQRSALYIALALEKICEIDFEIIRFTEGPEAVSHFHIDGEIKFDVAGSDGIESRKL